MARAKQQLEVAFFGSSLVSAWWNGAATYYRGILKELHLRGHRITFYEPDAYDRQSHRDISDPPYARSVVYPADGEEGVRRALAEASRADVVVKASGVGVFDELLEEAVLEHRRRGAIVVFWDVDAPATLDRLRENPADSFLSLVPEYDGIFTYGGGQPVVERYTRFGARWCLPVYNAVDPETHHPVSPDPRFEADLGFLGNRMPDRESRVREFFFGPAMELPERAFLLGGNGWAEGVPVLSNVRSLGHIYTSEHNAFNATPLAVLNVSRDSMAACGWSPATRVFEAAGAGGCLITDAWEGIDAFLEPGLECLVAEDGAAVASIVRGLTRERARAIGAAARERVLAEHTYAHRAERVLSRLLAASNQEVRAWSGPLSTS